MKCIIQRVLSASVSIIGNETASIGRGMLALIGFTDGDDAVKAKYIAEKLVKLRIFDDAEGKLNLSVQDTSGEILLVPNFTLYAGTAHGRRPDFAACLKSELSAPLFDIVVMELKTLFPMLKTGVFAADMKVSLINDGPLTLIVEK